MSAHQHRQAARSYPGKALMSFDLETGPQFRTPASGRVASVLWFMILTGTRPDLAEDNHWIAKDDRPIADAIG